MHRIERPFLSLLVAAGGLITSLSPVEAGRSGLAERSEELVEAVRPLRVFSSPGEQSRVVTRVRTGQAMAVLERRDRWLKVRTNGRIGWVTRTSVVALDLTGSQTRRSRRRPAEEALDDVRDLRPRRDRRAAARRRAARREVDRPRDLGDEAGDFGDEPRDLVDEAPDLGDEARDLMDEPSGLSSDAPDFADERVARRSRSKAPRARRDLADERLVRDDLADERRARRDVADRRRTLRGSDLDEEGGVAGRSIARTLGPAEEDPDTDDFEIPPEGERAVRDRRVAADLARDREDSPAAGERETRKRPAARETMVVTTAQAKLYQYPTSRSKPVDRAPEGTRLYVLERDNEWIMVENARGESAWVLESDVAPAARRRPGQSKLTRRAAIGLGYSSIGQKFAARSDEPTAEYRLSSGAAVLALGGEIAHDDGNRWILAADLAYRYTHATPGVRFTDPETMTTVDIGFKRHQVDLGGRAGYRLGGDGPLAGVITCARIGLHYDNLRINDVSNFDRNPARLPSEVLSGVKVGLLVDIPRLGDAWAARVNVDALPLFAGRTQTVGLEDGAASNTRALWGGALLQYAWDATYKVSAEYQYAYAKTTWTGVKEGSMRLHMAESARRKDSAHLLMVGVGRSF